MTDLHKNAEAVIERIERLRQALAQPKQEPVAWRDVAGKTTKYYDYNEQGRGEPLYTTPPKREWVGLTYKEVAECIQLDKDDFVKHFATYRAIEAKLKEKNT